MDKEQVPCYICTARALAHLMDDERYRFEPGELRDRLTECLNAMYEVYNLLPWPIPKEPQPHFSTHLRVQLRHCEHFTEDVDKSVDDSPF